MIPWSSDGRRRWYELSSFELRKGSVVERAAVRSGYWIPKVIFHTPTLSNPPPLFWKLSWSLSFFHPLITNFASNPALFLIRAIVHKIALGRGWGRFVGRYIKTSAELERASAMLTTDGCFWVFTGSGRKKRWCEIGSAPYWSQRIEKYCVQPISVLTSQY